jgi:hypothetical protein
MKFCGKAVNKKAHGAADGGVRRHAAMRQTIKRPAAKLHCGVGSVQIECKAVAASRLHGAGGNKTIHDTKHGREVQTTSAKSGVPAQNRGCASR